MDCHANFFKIYSQRQTKHAQIALNPAQPKTNPTQRKPNPHKSPKTHTTQNSTNPQQKPQKNLPKTYISSPSFRHSS